MQTLQVAERQKPKQELVHSVGKDRDIAAVFHELAEKWRAESLVLSDISTKSMNRSYQQVIGLGPDVLPLILEDLRQDPDDWFWALSAITRENPIRPEHAGNMDLMAQDWLEWGKQHGLA